MITTIRQARLLAFVPFMHFMVSFAFLKRIRAALVMGLVVAATPAWAGLAYNPMSVGWTQPPEGWWTIETAHFRIHYPVGAEDQAQHVVAVAEQAHAEITADLDWVPRGRTELVLSDDFDLANGWATPVPFNQSRLYLHAPDGINSLENHDDWLRLLVEHEYLHVVHLDKVRGVHGFLRRVFGRVPLFFPNLYQPGFMIEGLAIQYESDEAHGLGRAYSSYYAAQMRAQVAAGTRDLGEISLSVDRHWPPGDFYLYGAYFFRFLAEELGEEAAIKLVERYSSNFMPYRMHSTARRELGMDFHELWWLFQRWLEDNYPPLADRGPQGEQLTDHGLHHRAPVARGEAVYRFHSDGHGKPALLRYGPDDEQEVIFRTRHPGPVDVAPDGQVVMAAHRINRQNRFWSDLYIHDGGRLQRVTRDGRYREARWLNDGRLLARSMVGGVPSLWRLNPARSDRERLWRGEPGDILGQLAVHPEGGRIVAAYKPAGRSWQLARFDMDAREWVLLTDTGDIHGDPAFSADGQMLLFTADYGGVYDIHRLDLASGETHRLTRVDTAAFSPAMPLDGRLYYQYMDAGGYDLYRVADPEMTAPAAPAPVDEGREPPPAIDTGAPRPYRASGTLWPRWWLPELLATADSLNIGAVTGGNDALWRHQYQLAARVETVSGQPNGTLWYARDNRYQVLLDRDLSLDTAEVDDDDEVVRVRASDSLTLLRTNLASAMDDQLGAHAGVFYERDHELWRNRDVVGPSGDVHRGLAGVALRFDNRGQYHYNISPASGRRVQLVAESNEIISSDFEGEVFSLDWQEFFHLGRSHVLALRLIGVHADEAGLPVRLGDPTTQEGRLLGRDRYVLRGYGDGDLRGRRLALGSGEWRMPLARVQRNWHTLPLGLRDVHGALFAESARLRETDDPAQEGQRFDAVGLEVTTEFVLGYGAVLPVRVGVGQGLDDEFGETRAYLTIGSSF